MKYFLFLLGFFLFFLLSRQIEMSAFLLALSLYFQHQRGFLYATLVFSFLADIFFGRILFLDMTLIALSYGIAIFLYDLYPRIRDIAYPAFVLIFLVIKIIFCSIFSLKILSGAQLLSYIGLHFLASIGMMILVFLFESSSSKNTYLSTRMTRW